MGSVIDCSLGIFNGISIRDLNPIKNGKEKRENMRNNWRICRHWCRRRSNKLEDKSNQSILFTKIILFFPSFLAEVDITVKHLNSTLIYKFI